MELAVEDGDVARGGQVADAEGDDLQRRGVVQRRQVGQGFEAVVAILVDDLGGVVVAAVDDAVAGNADIFLLGDGGEVGVADELLEHVREGVVLGVDFGVVDALVFVDGLAVAPVF